MLWKIWITLRMQDPYDNSFWLTDWRTDRLVVIIIKELLNLFQVKLLFLTPNYLIVIITHLKSCLADATRKFKVFRFDKMEASDFETFQLELVQKRVFNIIRICCYRA